MSVTGWGQGGPHTDGTRIVQYQSDDQNSMKTTIMQMPMDFLEIPEPSLPRGFLELAEETRYVDVGSGQSCYTEEVQSHEAGLTRPVLVTIMGAVRLLGSATQWTSWA